jgi:hypothetical protein
MLRFWEIFKEPTHCFAKMSGIWSWTFEKIRVNIFKNAQYIRSSMQLFSLFISPPYGMFRPDKIPDEGRLRPKHIVRMRNKSENSCIED